MPPFSEWRPPLELVLAHGGTEKSGKYVSEAKVGWSHDDAPDLSWLERPVEQYMAEGVTREEAEQYAALDRKRIETYGETWYMVGLWAEAEVVLSGTVQTIRSPGLWGIESDAGDYFRSIAREEVSQLNDILAEMGLQKEPYEIDEVNLP